MQVKKPYMRRIFPVYLRTFVGKVAVFATLEASDLIQSLEPMRPAVTLQLTVNSPFV